MTVSFIGQKDFTETSLAEMRAVNKGQTPVVVLEVDGTPLKKDLRASKLTHPIYVDRVYNAQFGVGRNWDLSFKDSLRLKGFKVSDIQLQRWFNYEDPSSVNLYIGENPDPSTQVLNLDW